MDGPVFQVVLEIADDVEVGDYPIILQDVQMTKKVGTAFDTIFAPTYTSILTIDDILMGDVNNDGLARFSAG